MKKLLALLLCLAMLTALAACGAKNEPAETPAETPAEAPAEPEEPAEEPETPAEEPAEEPEAPEEAPAEEPEEAPEGGAAAEDQPMGGLTHVEVFSSSPASYDWDGDGTADTFTFGPTENYANGGELCMQLSGGGKAELAGLAAIDYVSIRFADGDRDGVAELYLSGSDGTDNYVTYAWRLTDGAPEQLFFGGAEEPTAFIDGALQDELDADGNLCFERLVRALGTYGARCAYTVSGGMVEPVADAVCDFTRNDTMLETAQELPAFALTARNALPAGEAMTVPSGTQLCLTGAVYTADGMTVCFETADGAFGAFALTKTEHYTWQIGDIAEEDAFVFLPYAG